MQKVIVRDASLTLLCNADFSGHAARRSAPTRARSCVRCAVAISRANITVGLDGSLPANPANDRRVANCCDAQKYFSSTVKSAII